jgi:hypothetical protein
MGHSRAMEGGMHTVQTGCQRGRESSRCGPYEQAPARPQSASVGTMTHTGAILLSAVCSTRVGAWFLLEVLLWGSLSWQLGKASCCAKWLRALIS